MNRQEITALYLGKFMCNFLVKPTSDLKKILKISKQKDPAHKGNIIRLRLLKKHTKLGRNGRTLKNKISMKMYELTGEKNFTICEGCHKKRVRENPVLYMILVKGCMQSGTHVGRRLWPVMRSRSQH